ncbi:MAG: ATPase, T2SS/T4P/T4SS family [Candidatus Altiarchaeota archaeon]
MKNLSEIKKEILERKEKILETYEIDSEGIKTKVEIVEKDHVPLYRILIPEVDTATGALLDSIKERLIGKIEITSEIFEPEVMNKLKEEFKKDAEFLLDSELPELDKKIKENFILNLLNELLGLGKIEFFLNDPSIEEVVVNSAKEPIRVYHKRYGWIATNITPDSEAQIQNYANTIARRVGREITTLNPLLDAHLITKDRANAIISPIATKGNTITIRKFARDPWTVTDFIQNKTANSEIMALIWLTIQYEMNILISGGTGSGKTSFLNICMPFIPPNHRIISIEDTRELQLPQYLYWCPLTTRQPNPEGKGEVSMLDLLVNSLRMRPDRIIMGEIRKKREAEVLFEAMHTGHSVYATLHADTCAQTITRLTNPPIDIPESMLDAVHLNVVMFRDRRRGIRRVYEIGEFVQDPNSEKIKFIPNILYKWNARDDSIERTKTSASLYEKIGTHTGLTQEEIEDEIKLKKSILEWMLKNNVRQIEDVGKILNIYYRDTKTVENAVKREVSPKKLLR